MTGLGSVNDKVDLVCLSGQPSMCVPDGRSLDETRTLLIDSLRFFLADDVEMLKSSTLELTQK